jgi:hypothetical protein
MKLKRIPELALALAAGILFLRPVLNAQQPPAGAQDEAPVATDHQLMAEVKDHNELMKNLEYLADQIGPRLTGSPNLDRASHWTEQRFKDYGLENVHLESWTVPHSWARGPATGRMVSPVDHPFTLASAAWAAGTHGPVRGPVIYMKAKTEEDLAQYKGKLKGAYLIMSEPPALEPPLNPMLVPFGDPDVPINTVTNRPPGVRGPTYFRFLMAMFRFAADEGAAGILVSSDKKYGLLNMLSVGGPTYMENPLPVVIISWEDYNWIWRLLPKGPVEVEFNIQNSFGKTPTTVYNTVAEIKGSEKPDEVVILGGHLDSWDLGTGATDNGTGAMAVLEAARALQASGVKPKRTIRFILFTGEEQGLVGSQQYVEAHKDELPKISGALIDDTGTGKALSIGMMGNYQDREIMDQVVAPLHDLGFLELSLREMGGSDHASFDGAGVPGFWIMQDPMDYAQTHHSQADTFDRVVEADLVQGAQVLAVWAYNVAQLPEMLPRKPATATPPMNSNAPAQTTPPAKPQ